MAEPLPVVWVVDDDASVRVAVARVLRAAAFDAVLLASPAEVLERIQAGRPDCLVLDLWLPEISGIELLEVLEARGPQIPVVFLTGQGDVRSCAQAMKLGAIDFLEKPVDEGQLLDAVIRAIARGRVWSEAREIAVAASDRLRSLTRREREVFRLVALGRPNKRIAAELGTTEKTIKVHRGRVMHKLGAGSIVDLVRLADQTVSLAG
jgi:FixJ family two-component response regulator